jgi:hypothetical protein
MLQNCDIIAFVDPIELAQRALKYAPTAAAKARIEAFMASYRPTRSDALSVLVPVQAADAVTDGLTVREAAAYLACTEVWIRTRFAKALTGRPRKVARSVLDEYARSRRDIPQGSASDSQGQVDQGTG